MVRMLKPAAIVGAVLMLSSAPAFAQVIDLGSLGTILAPFGQALNPLNLELDPLHIITPAPAAPAPEPMMKKHFRHHRHKIAKKK